MDQLSILCAELTELAFALERDGDRVAADVATYATSRLKEICDSKVSANLPLPVLTSTSTSTSAGVSA